MTEVDATHGPSVDPAAAARLARLQARSTSDRAQPPAAASKVVAAGASVMAVLGLMAVYGQRASSSTATSSVVVDPAAIPATSAPSADAPVIVVLVDDTGGAAPVDGGTANDVTVVTLARPEAPTRVDLAVPAPEMVSVPSQTPAQATSSGS